jgi:hypothetical protein
MNRALVSSILAVVACASALRGAGLQTVAAPLAPRELYLQALDAMSKVDEPAYVTYDLEGHALHLWSHSGNPYQQLSDVIIDLSFMRFCMVRFLLRAPGMFGGAVTLEEHFGEVGAYWIETDGVVEGTTRYFGIDAGRKRWYFRLTNMQFPQTIRDVTFEPTPAKD